MPNWQNVVFKVHALYQSTIQVRNLVPDWYSGRVNSTNMNMLEVPVLQTPVLEEKEKRFFFLPDALEVPGIL